MDSSTGYESFRAATAPQASGATPRAQSARGRRQNLSQPPSPRYDVNAQRAAEDPGHRPPKDLNLPNSSFRQKNSRPANQEVPTLTRSPSLGANAPKTTGMWRSGAELDPSKFRAIHMNFQMPSLLESHATWSM